MRRLPWHRLGDLGLCGLFGLFAMMRTHATLSAVDARDWLGAAHHGVISLALLITAWLPLIRRAPVARGAGVAPKLIAAVGASTVIPLSLLPLTWRPDWLLTVTTLGIIAVTLGEIWALLTLRRSFSVFPEARALMTGGPYGIVRHPIYALYIVTYCLLALPRASLAAVGIAGCGILALILRARREEAVLRSAFPAYDDYARRVPAFLPRRGRGREALPDVAAAPMVARSDGGEQAVA